MRISRQGGRGVGRGQGGREARVSLHTHYSIFLRIKEKKKKGTKVHMIKTAVNVKTPHPRIWALFPSWQESGWFLRSVSAQLSSCLKMLSLIHLSNGGCQ